MNFSTFRAFQSRNYRLYFAGQSISLIGAWMQKTAVSWIVYLLTHSTFMLGLSLFASQFPSFLLSLLGGVVSDRYNRFKVLLITQIASMIQSLGLAALVLLGPYRTWEIILLGTVSTPVAISQHPSYLCASKKATTGDRPLSTLLGPSSEQ